MQIVILLSLMITLLAGEPEFYVASLSPKTINYKAMVMPELAGEPVST
jgi:glutamate synthase domain-containing protein 1